MPLRRTMIPAAVLVQLTVSFCSPGLSRTIEQSYCGSAVDTSLRIVRQFDSDSSAADADSLPDTVNTGNIRVNPFLMRSDSSACKTESTTKPFLKSEVELRSLRPRDETGYLLISSSVVTIALLATDQRTYEALYGWRTRNPIVNAVSPFLTELGSGYFSAGVFGSFLAYGALAKDKGAVRTGKLGLESFLASGVVVQILKHTFGRERPTVATQPGGYWHGPLAHLIESRPDHQGVAHFDAFPSGHTASAFAAATILSDVYETPVVAYISYTLAAGVGISRITEQTHWASDVFVGALIGIFSAKLVESLNADKLPIRVEPYTRGSNYGLRLEFLY